MNITPFPTFSWSFSRQNLFNTCRRAYRYSYYDSHNGWLRYNVSDRAQHVYRLKKITTFPLLFGGAVHDIIYETLLGWFERRTIPSEEELIDRLRQKMNDSFLEAKYEYDKWYDRPSKSTMLYEFYYGLPLNDDEIKKYRTLIPQMIRSFLQSTTWQTVTQEPDRYQFVQLEDFTTISIGGTNVFVVLDVLLHDTYTNEWHIVDWKTGKPNDHDAIQLVLYEQFVVKKYDVHPSQIHLHNEYLATGTIRSFQADDAQRQLVSDIFSAGVEEMRALTVSDDNEPAPLERFPRAPEENRKWTCYRCSFREICEEDPV